MPLTDAEIAAALAPAGLQFIERFQGEVRLPLKPGKSAASSEDGRFDAAPDEVVDVDDPDLAAKLNAGWLRMATEYGLLNEQREFLLSMDYRPESDDGEWAWVRVRLLDGWDFVGSEIEQLRGGFSGMFTTRYVPEFFVISLDQRVHMHTTIWGNGTVSTIAIRP